MKDLTVSAAHLEVSMRLLLTALLWLGLVACDKGSIQLTDGPSGADSSVEGDADADSDADSDTDADADTDSDTDTDTAVGECADASNLKPQDCPKECTGGCPDDSSCIVDCSGINACQNLDLTCPKGMSCAVDCSGTNACQLLRLECPKEAPCEVECSGLNACQQGELSCPDTAHCDIHCTGMNGCLNTVMTCGAKACHSECTGQGARLGAQVCGKSCDCVTGCG